MALSDEAVKDFVTLHSAILELLKVPAFLPHPSPALCSFAYFSAQS